MIELAGIPETLFTNNEQNRACYKAATDAYQLAEKLFVSYDEESKPRWKKALGETNAWECQDVSDGQFTCQTFQLAVAPEKLFNDFQSIDFDSAWSPRLNSRKTVGFLGEQSEIIYRMQSSIISASSRDLVCARVWREIATNSYLIASRSATTDLMPPQARIQRVHLNLFAIRIRTILMKNEQCLVDFLYDGEGKGWLSTEEELHNRAAKLKGGR